MEITIRNASLEDATTIVCLIQELAASGGEQSMVNPEYVRQYLSSATGEILLAIDGDEVVGLISYSIRPDLYHAGPTGLIEELVVLPNARNKGIGSILVDRLIDRLKQAGCKEVSVSTMADNLKALRFYRRHGFADEAVYLEMHF